MSKQQTNIGLVIEKTQGLLPNNLQNGIQTGYNGLRIVFSNNMAKVGLVIILVFTIAALFAPQFAPHDPQERVTDQNGLWEKDLSPSLNYPLGTTGQAYPLFSQLIYGSRIAFVIGLLTAIIVAGFGTLIGIIAGYRGGYVENFLMRVVDTAYGLPFLPFIIVLILALGRGYGSIVLAISLIMWRGTARVIRSEIVSIKEQPMIEAAISSGASDFRIIFYHLLPKVLPITMLYSVFAIGWAIIAEAGLSFIGFGVSNQISWGQILNSAHTGSAFEQGMWIWIAAPGLCIVLFVISTYFISLGIEELANPQLRTGG